MKTLFIAGLMLAVLSPTNALSLYNSLQGINYEENLNEGNNWGQITDRSLLRNFYIRVEGNLLLLSTDKQMDDFSIQVKDAQEHIVYTEDHLSLSVGEVYPILIDDWSNGQYTVIFRQDEKQIDCWSTK